MNSNSKQSRHHSLACSSLAQLEALKKIKEDYKLLKVLGKGVEGTVYKARVRASGELVAIKEVQCSADHFYNMKQILREVSILRHLSSLHGASSFIAALVDVIELEGDANNPEANREIFIIMDYIQGLPLKDFLDKCQRREILLTTEEARLLIFNLLRAVEFIHKAGVLHRDLKPANLMVLPDFSVKIIDFGLARTIAVASAQEIIPQSSQQQKEVAAHLRNQRKSRKRASRNLSPHVYTRIYRPPEVCLLEASYSFSADVWSLGCIIAEILQCQKIYNLRREDLHFRYMFKAMSCYPLSPLPGQNLQHPSSLELDENDLMRVILRVLGDQSSEDQSFISSSRIMEFIEDHQEGAQPVQFEREFIGTPKELSGLIGRCLKFNPFFRSSVSDLLASPAFEQIRKHQSSDVGEDFSPGHGGEEAPPLFLDFDRPGEFDYSQCQSNNLKVSDLEEMLRCEAETLRKQVRK